MRLLALIFAAFVVACSGADSDTKDSTTDTSDSVTDTSDSGEETEPVVCSTLGYEVDATYAEIMDDGWMITLENWSKSSGLMIESWDEFNGPDEPGVFDLAGSNYEDCELCLLICNNFDGEYCERFFYAEQGTVEIVSVDLKEGGAFEAIFNDVIFTEVTIDNNYRSTPVEGGLTWCMESEMGVAGEFEGSDDWAGDDLVGEPLPDLTAPDQSGNEITLSDYQGAMLAILFNANDWCPYCVNEAAVSEALWQELDADDERYGVSYVQILYDGKASPATQKEAKAWSLEHGISHPVLHGEAASEYFDASGVGAFPCYWIADPLGTLRHAVCGEGSLTTEVMGEAFESFLTDNPTWTRQ